MKHDTEILKKLQNLQAKEKVLENRVDQFLVGSNRDIIAWANFESDRIELIKVKEQIKILKWVLK